MRIILKARPNSSNRLYRSVFPMRVAFIAKESPNGLYRAILPLTGLVARGHEVRALAPSKAKSLVTQLEGIDVLHVHRYCDPAVQRLMRAAQQRGIAVVWDDDDDAGSNRGTAAYKQASGLAWERRRADVNRVLAIADLVTTPSPELASRFSERGAREVTVVENYVPALFLGARGAPGPGVTVGWAAAAEHAHDAAELSIAPLLQRLLDERPELRVVTVGLRLDIKSERYEYVKWVRLIEDEPETRALGRRADNVQMRKMAPGLVTRTAGFDVAIAPLVDAPFNRARSNVKLKEYSAGGSPWLASPIGPYRGMGEAQGGRLVPDDGWHEAIARLLDRPRERRKLSKRASSWVQQETLEKNAHRWEQALEYAVELAKAKAGTR